MGLTLQPKAAPVVFWDLYGQKGHPIRTTVSEIGPLLLARMLNGHVEAVLDLEFNLDKDERHRFAWGLDQTFLEPVARQLRTLSAAYPSPFPASILEPSRAAEPQKSDLISRTLDAIFGKRPDPL